MERIPMESLVPVSAPVSVHTRQTCTVGELILKLQGLNPLTRVLTEGCDCIGEVQSIQVDDDGDVILCRS